MKHNDIECHVLCDDVPLTEYQENLEGEASMSCYVASEIGKRFTVRITSEPRLCCHLWVDGQCMYRVFKKPFGSYIFEGALVTATQLRSFLFSNIELTDDENALQKDNPSVKDLGSICLKVIRVKDYQEGTKEYAGSNAVLEGKPLHETAKKGGGHRVLLGDCEAREPSQVASATYIDSTELPYLTFTWRYRPKDMLQAQAIIPVAEHKRLSSSNKRPASSTPLAGPSKRRQRNKPPSDAKPEDMIDVDLEDLRTRKDDLEAQRAALEEQHAALEAQLRQAEAGRVKREGSPIVIVGGGSGEVIDLTGD